MKLWLYIFWLYLLCHGVAWGNEQVVLVTAQNSTIQHLNSFELREIYLGFPVSASSGEKIKALINKQDDYLERIFFQNVVSMSKKAYVHRVLSQMIRRGIPRPDIYHSQHALHYQLLKTPESVSYMWMKDVLKYPDLKVLRVLWKRN